MMAGQEGSKDEHEHLVGICMGMCPNAEVRLRQREKIIHPLEMAVDSNGRRLNYPQARAMVKMYSRPAAGQEVKASDVRPVPILMKTLKYLLANVCCRKDVSWALVYQFVSDRLQAIRQDLCVQGVRNAMALHIYQAAVRFYIYAHYRTCEHELKDFDPYLNMKQLSDTLSLVMSLYQELDFVNTVPASVKTDLRDYTSFNSQDEESEENESDSDSNDDDGAETKIVQDSKASEKVPPSGEESTSDSEDDNCMGNDDVNRSEGDSPQPHGPQDRENVLPSERRNKMLNDGDIITCSSLQEEGVALYMLVNLGKEEAIMNVLRFHQNIKYSKLVSLTLKMNIAWLTHNYYRVLKLSTCLPPLCQCAFHLHLTGIQRISLGIINQSHNCKEQVHSLEQLSEMLFYNNSDELAKACTHYGLHVTNGGVVFTKGKFNWGTSLIKPCHTRRIEDHLTTLDLADLLLPTLSH